MLGVAIILILENPGIDPGTSRTQSALSFQLIHHCTGYQFSSICQISVDLNFVFGLKYYYMENPVIDTGICRMQSKRSTI